MECGRSTGSSFQTPSNWSNHFSDLGGWKLNTSNWQTIQLADVNGDGKEDACGRAADGIHCALSNGTSFAIATLWGPAFSDDNFWGSDPSNWATITLVDINGDKKADICARGSAGIMCALSDGISFGELTLWTAGFSDASNWKTRTSYWSTIRFPDVNGDGKADVCGRGSNGIYCALSNGTSFTGFSDWGDFSDAQGWRDDETLFKTISFSDINGDGKADVCGRGLLGMYCQLSTGSSFSTFINWGGFSDSDGWNSDPSYWSTIRLADVNGDGKADTCGRGVAGVWCLLSNGTSFAVQTLWSPDFSDAAGWKLNSSYWGTIQFIDLNADGKLDVCGRASGGLQCALSLGTGFSYSNIWTSFFWDFGNWSSSPSYWQTIQFGL